MYLGSLGLPLPLGVIIIIPGKPSERVPGRVCAERASVWGGFSPTLGLFQRRARPLGARFRRRGLGATLTVKALPNQMPGERVTLTRLPLYVQETLEILPSVCLNFHDQVQVGLTGMCVFWSRGQSALALSEVGSKASPSGNLKLDALGNSFCL